MAIDYAEKERTFVAELETYTGRDLNGWMQAITDANLPHRNDIIDWLRDQGFTFPDASWLERIHANGGRLIYADDASGAERPEIASPPKASSTHSHAERKSPVAKVLAFPSAKKDPPPATAPAIIRAPASLALDDDVEALLAAAKGLRPLALLTLSEILRILPDSKVTTDGSLIWLAAPRRYLAVLPAPKALRIYGDFAGTGDGRVVHAETAMKLPGKPPPPFAAALDLSDARLVDHAFAEIVKTAARRAHA